MTALQSADCNQCCQSKFTLNTHTIDNGLEIGRLFLTKEVIMRSIRSCSILFIIGMLCAVFVQAAPLNPTLTYAIDANAGTTLESINMFNTVTAGSPNSGVSKIRNLFIKQNTVGAQGCYDPFLFPGQPSDCTIRHHHTFSGGPMTPEIFTDAALDALPSHWKGGKAYHNIVWYPTLVVRQTVNGQPEVIGIKPIQMIDYIVNPFGATFDNVKPLPKHFKTIIGNHNPATASLTDAFHGGGDVTKSHIVFYCEPISVALGGSGLTQGYGKSVAISSTKCIPGDHLVMTFTYPSCLRVNAPLDQFTYGNADFVYPVNKTCPAGFDVVPQYFTIYDFLVPKNTGLVNLENTAKWQCSSDGDGVILPGEGCKTAHQDLWWNIKPEVQQNILDFCTNGHRDCKIGIIGENVVNGVTYGIKLADF